jgi:hypothetical protein
MFTMELADEEMCTKLGNVNTQCHYYKYGRMFGSQNETVTEKLQWFTKGMNTSVTDTVPPIKHLLATAVTKCKEYQLPY